VFCYYPTLFLIGSKLNQFPQGQFVLPIMGDPVSTHDLFHLIFSSWPAEERVQEQFCGHLPASHG